jgi:hypothetical protein
LNEKEGKLKTNKGDLSKREKELSDSIMELNNKITMLKIRFEELDSDNKRSKELEQQSASQKLDKVNQIARIMFSIDHLEYFCKNKTID